MKNWFEPKKIIVIGNSWGDATGNYAEEQQIAKDFESLGHKVDFIERDTWHDGIQKVVNPVDMIFIAKNPYISNQDIDKLKEQYQAKIVYWTSDFARDYELEQSVGLFQKMDVVITKNLVSRSFFEKNKINFLYCPYDVAVDFVKKEKIEGDPEALEHFWVHNYYPKEVPVGFIGNWVHDPWRMKFLHNLQQVFGNDMFITAFMGEEFAKGQGAEEYKLTNIKQGIFGKLYCQLVGITKINLSIESVISEGFWSNRTARLMCAGGFVLCYYVKGMERVFKDYVVYCYSEKDCIEKIKYYLEHEEERKRLAQRGYEYANKWLRSIERTKELLIYLNSLEANENVV